MKKNSLVPLVILLLALSFLSGMDAEARTYTTNFPLTGNLISEDGNRINGKTIGFDSADVSTTPGLAFGCQSGSNGYDDSTALLTGSWSSDQSVTATVYFRNQSGGNSLEEVENRLRSSLSAHSCTGYEILFRCLKDSSSYVQIVRWNGPLGNFTCLADQRGAQFGISDGDMVRATIVGIVITAYVNNVQVAQATDKAYSSGSAGMVFFLQDATAMNRDYGFASFTASDQADSSGHTAFPERQVRILFAKNYRA